MKTEKIVLDLVLSTEELKNYIVEIHKNFTE